MDSKLKLPAAEEIIARENQAAKTKVAGGANAAFSQAMKKEHFSFGLFILVSLAAFWPTLKELEHAALNFDFCSQILAAPFITIALVYWRRRRIFRELKSGLFLLGGALFFAGLVVYWVARREAALLGVYNSLSVATFGIVLIWIAGFYSVYGLGALRLAAFPIAFLVFAIPIPSYILDCSVFYLQSGSTAIAHDLFRLLGVPVLRRGFLLALPGLTIEVAKECSSIRSSLALLITCLMADCLFLQSAWKRAALVLLALPISIFKNGVRIVTLSLLSIYVNPAFMKSDLHRDGGIVFYLLALAILFPIFRWFERSDRCREIELRNS